MSAMSSPNSRIADVPQSHDITRRETTHGTQRSRRPVRHACVEYGDGHSDIDHRMDAGLPFLYRALGP